MPNIYQRPEVNYVTKTSTSNANRFQEEAQRKEPLKASDLDKEFNALIDNDNALADAIAEVVGGVFPGASLEENRNKIVYSDGTKADWKKLSAENIADNSITYEKIANNAVIRGKVAIGAIGTNNLIDRNVTNAKLGDSSVNTRTLADSSVTTPKIQDGSVTASKLSVNSVTTEKILDNSVTTSKFADGSFTTDKLANNSLTPKKTKGCFILGELKFSVLDLGDNSIIPYLQGWIPISPLNIGCLIPANCFPELRDQLRRDSNNTNKLSGTTRYISLKTYQSTSNYDPYQDGLVFFDFSALLGAYPMLIGGTFPVQSEVALYALASTGVDVLLQDTQPDVQQMRQELESGNFTKWNIPKQTIRDYANGTIATANAGYDFAGSQQHQTSRRFGEETIKLEVENIPAHTHGFSYHEPNNKVSSGVGETYYGNFLPNTVPLLTNSTTASTGGSKALPHLPPSIALYGYIYGGDYDPNGWPPQLRVR